MSKIYPRRNTTTPATPIQQIVHKVIKPPDVKQGHKRMKKPKFSAVRKHFDQILERATQRFDSMVEDMYTHDVEEQAEEEIKQREQGLDHIWGGIDIHETVHHPHTVNRFHDLFDNLQQERQNILEDIPAQRPSYEFNIIPAESPFQRAYQHAAPAPASRDPHEVFAAKVLMTDDDFMDDGEYIHCDNDPDYDEKKLARKEANSFKANDNQIAQCRPKGSSTLRSTYPRELLTCPCKCSMRNPSSELGLYNTLVNFYEKGWVNDGEHLGLFIPGFNHLGTKNCPAVVGIFRAEHTMEGYIFSFYDPGSGTVHCCPISWFYASFMDLVAEGQIPDTDAVALQVREQIRLKSNVYRFINVLAINVSFFQMALNYRHDIGQHNLRHNTEENGKVRVTFKDAQTAHVQFKTREQLARFFSPKAQPLWPDITSLWMKAATRRIAQLEQANDALRMSIAISMQGE